MSSLRWFGLFGLLTITFPAASEAGGRHRGGHCRPRHAYQATLPAPIACSMPPASYRTIAATVATPQGVPPASYGATAPPPRGVSPASAPVPAVAGVEPAYEYSAPFDGQPAYYYTYDASGKLVVAQWMDWLFRGGRAAGEPAPPLPIIGALRGR